MGKKMTTGLSRREQRILDRNAVAAPAKERTYQSTFQPPQLVAKNPRQASAMKALREGVKCIFLMGSAGTGKSMITADRAAAWLRQRSASQGKKVYLVRPPVGTGQTVGLLPGDLEEKLGPWFAQILSHMGKFMKPGDLQYMLDNEVIEMKALEHMRGMSLENCIIIVEEAQNLEASQVEMMLTRLGDDAQMIFTGDEKQHDLRGESGMKSAITLMERMLQTQPEYMSDEDLDSLDDNLAVIRFLPGDVVRSGFTKAVVTMYYHND